MVAPTLMKSESRIEDPTPASFSTKTRWPCRMSSWAPAGVRATRYSRFLTSRGTEIFTAPPGARSGVTFHSAFPGEQPLCATWKELVDVDDRMSITAGLRVFDAGLDRLVTRLPALIGRLAASKCEEYGDVTWRCTRVRVGRPCRRDLRPGLVSLLCGRGESPPSHMAFPPGTQEPSAGSPGDPSGSRESWFESPHTPLPDPQGSPAGPYDYPSGPQEPPAGPYGNPSDPQAPPAGPYDYPSGPQGSPAGPRDPAPEPSGPYGSVPSEPSFEVRRDRPSLRPARKGRRGVHPFADTADTAGAAGSVARQAQVARPRGESAQRRAG